MNLATTIGNVTQLVFCRENVDPDFVSQMLDLAPSESVRIGESTEHLNGTMYTSRLGIWKMNLPNANSDLTIEEQIGLWIVQLRPKTLALKDLRAIGYCPYLDCKAEARSLSLCIEPTLLSSLGELNVSLSIWLYEQPHA